MSTFVMERATRPDGPRWFPADVTIVDTKTGERGTYLTWESDPDEDGLGSIEFCWSEHNNACDCNRADYLARALGRADEPEFKCGDGRFRVESIVDTRDGRIIYHEEAGA